MSRWLVIVWFLGAWRFEAAESAPDTLSSLQARIAGHISQPRFGAAMWGIKISSLESGKVLFETNSEKLFSPASNSKLFTCALALDRLGGDYRMGTSLYAEAKPAPSGELNGNLIVYGRGDPSINARRHQGDLRKAFEPFADAVVKAGIKLVRGDLIADESFFHGPPYGAGWAWDDLEYYYGAEISALTVDANSLEVVVRAGGEVGEPCHISLVPSGTLMLVTYSNRTHTVAAGERRRIDIFRPLGENVIYISGEMPLGDSTYTNEVTMHNPAVFFGNYLQEALSERGVRVTGRVRAVNWLDRQVAPLDVAKLFPIGTIDSPPLRDIVRDILKPSQNLYTDLLLAHLGETLRTAADARRTSEDLGIIALEKFAAEAGIKKGELQFEEGSGLSRNNLVTPSAIVALLQFMSHHREAEAFREGLPIAGIDGTLRSRMRNTAAQGNVRAKTGTLRWANTISGYLTNAVGERLVFSVMLNRYPAPAGSTARTDIDVIPVLLATSTVRVNLAENAEPAPGDERMLDMLRQIGKKYTERSEIFVVKTFRRKKTLVAGGVVETPGARAEIISSLSPIFGQVVDEIEVLREGKPARSAWGIVRVSVGNVRKQIGHQAELGTQVLMGAVLKIWKEEGEWFFVQTPENYFGWVTGSSMVTGGQEMADAWNAAGKVMVTDLESRIWDKGDKHSLPVCDAVIGMTLQKFGAAGTWLKVGLPDGREGFIAESAVTDFEDWKRAARPIADNIEKTAKAFFGIPYLWGGTSSKGLDCSGFTKTVFYLNGLQLSRDAWQQAEQGTEIAPGKDFSNLRKGDLLFFSEFIREKNPLITHVAIYLEHQVYIHASGMVRLNSFEPGAPLFDEHRLKTFLLARRILPGS